MCSQFSGIISCNLHSNPATQVSLSSPPLSRGKKLKLAKSTSKEVEELKFEPRYPEFRTPILSTPLHEPSFD